MREINQELSWEDACQKFHGQMVLALVTEEVNHRNMVLPSRLVIEYIIENDDDRTEITMKKINNKLQKNEEYFVMPLIPYPEPGDEPYDAEVNFLC